MFTIVGRQIRRGGKPPIAYRTRIWFFPCVYSNVNFQRGGLRELLAALVARVRLFTCVCAHVFLQILVPRELTFADRASGQVLSRVSPGVFLQIRSRGELLIAGDAGKLLAGVFHHVRLQLGRVIANLGESQCVCKSPFNALTDLKSKNYYSYVPYYILRTCTVASRCVLSYVQSIGTSA